MELRFLERRISESPRVYRAGAKSSIGVWARQVCAAVPAIKSVASTLKQAIRIKPSGATKIEPAN
jgi:hypothetical protein